MQQFDSQKWRANRICRRSTPAVSATRREPDVRGRV